MDPRLQQTASVFWSDAEARSLLGTRVVATGLFDPMIPPGTLGTVVGIEHDASESRAPNALLWVEWDLLVDDAPCVETVDRDEWGAVVEPACRRHRAAALLARLWGGR